MFLKEGGLCHPENTEIIPISKSLFCRLCQKIVASHIDEYFIALPTHLSLYAAQLYVNQTGDVTIRCKFPVENIPWIRPPVQKETGDLTIRYDLLQHVIRLLGLMNGHFFNYCDAQTGENYFDPNLGVHVHLLRNFLKKFESTINTYKPDAEESFTEQQQYFQALKAICSYTRTCLKQTKFNLFQQFSVIYVPYVRKFVPDVKMETAREIPCLLSDLLKQLNADAAWIRNTYGPYSVHFDMTYALVYMYMFSDNFYFMVSVMLTFLANICCNFYSLPAAYKESCLDLLVSHLKNNVRNSIYLMYDIKNVRQGHIEDVLTIQFTDHLRIMKEAFTKVFSAYWLKHHKTNTTQEIEYAESQIFPYLLFPNDEQYYSFMMVTPALIKLYHVKSGQIEKNVLARCKSIMRFIQHYMNKLKKFQDNSDDKLYWTPDVFRMFIGTDDSFITGLQELFNVLGYLAEQPK